jgi:hypothetical protein
MDCRADFSIVSNRFFRLDEHCARRNESMPGPSENGALFFFATAHASPVVCGDEMR